MLYYRNWGFTSLAVLVAAVMNFSAGVDRTAPDVATVSAFGKQPAIAVDDRRNIHVVFGRGMEIYYSASEDGARTFSEPRKVGVQQKLALGATRGPQIVATENYLVVAAADHRGNIMAYRSKHGANRWSDPVNLLKGDSSAKEGFVAIASGKQDQVYAAWLDLSVGNQNNIFSAYSLDGGNTWSDRKLVYRAPEGKVCPCCRPAIAADKTGNVFIMFRNELQGARDLYLAHSRDAGKTFGPAQKLGSGTWMLQQCPMDGGGVAIGGDGSVGTTWRRENIVYYAEPGKPEIKIGEGRASSVAKNSKGNYLVWQRGTEIIVLTPDRLIAEVIGTGAYPRLAAFDHGHVICVWESGGTILAKKLP